MNIGFRIVSYNGNNSYKNYYIMTLFSANTQFMTTINVNYEVTSKFYSYLKVYHNWLIATKLEYRLDFKIMISGLIL